MKSTLLTLLGAAAAVMMIGGASAQDMDSEKVLNVYNWADYIGPTTVEDFSKKYGIKVQYDNFGSGNELEAKVMAGHSGYDIIVPSTMFYPRGLKAGIFLPLDKSKLPNWKNLDEVMLKSVSDNGTDPGNKYAMPYIWGIASYIYNVDMIKQRMPDAPTDSLRMIFDPDVVAKFKDCGINFVDSPEDVVQLALIYLGKSPNTKDLADIQAAYDLLAKVHPFVRTIDSANYMNALSAGDICISVGWTGNDLLANKRAQETGKTFTLKFVVPKEGAPMYLDNMMIPSDAPHPKNAHLFLDYIMSAAVAADITNSMGLPMANTAAKALVKPEIAGNTAIYPDAQTMQRVIVQQVRTTEANQAVAAGWVRFKAGQ